MFHLVITMPFGTYAAGDRVTDQGEIALLEEAHHGKFVRVTAPEPEPTAAPARRAKAEPTE